MKKINIAPDLARITHDIDTLAMFVDSSKPGWTRRPFTPWYEQGRSWLKQQMLDMGMEVKVDDASNLIGTLQGSDLALPSFIVGSHTDTVTGGGRFDGIIGVIAGLEMVRILKGLGLTLRHTLEIIDFTAEEPSEFGVSTIGSRGMVGNLSEEMLVRKDPSGLVLQDAIRATGGNTEMISKHARRKDEVSLYLELHIEQGPVLEQTHHKLGIVTGIVGIHRYRVIVEGEPNHAGTTPMEMRADALTGASQIILDLEAICKLDYAEPVVGTVGKLIVEPNASNVIPGRVIFELEVRSLAVSILEQMIAELIDKSQQIANTRKLKVSFDCLSKSEPIRVSEEVQRIIREASEHTAPTISLPSGAGHDANQLSRITSIGMIFVPSKDGRSHCPEEWTSYEDVATGVEALTRSVIHFDQYLDT